MRYSATILSAMLARCRPGLALLALPLASLWGTAAQAQTTTSFAYTGSTQSYTVPAGVTQLRVVATGASGGVSTFEAPFTGPPPSSQNVAANRLVNTLPYGAIVTATITVTPGQLLTVVVGGQGTSVEIGGSATPVSGGYNGGGRGTGASSGGGATDLRSPASTTDYLSARKALVVAGAGGGYTPGSGFGSGGSGGTPNGGTATGGGAGGTQTAAGSGAMGGSAGSNNLGGNATTAASSRGCGGGGGYYGGGGGGTPPFNIFDNCGGGGGSSFVTATGSSAITYTTASSEGNGSLTITTVVAAVAPTLTSLSPTSGPVGTSVTLTGTGFTAGSTVSFNGTAASVTFVSATSLTATVPVGAMTGNVTVTTAGGTSSGISFTVTTPATAPVVTTAAASAITATSATLGGNVTADGGATITERGVVYSATNATPTTADTKAVATGTTGAFTVATTGLTASTAYNVRAYAINSVGTSYGSAVSFTTVSNAPTLTSISPNAGTIGSTVTLTGTNLTGATTITFAGTASNTVTTGFTVNAAGTSITGIVVPNGTTNGNVTVTTPNGTSNGVSFTVTQPTAVTWTGATSTAWATATNWSPAVVPTINIDAAIPAAPANQPVVSGVQTARDLNVAAGASLTLATRANLTLGSIFNPLGTLTLGSGSTLTQGAGSEVYIAVNLQNNGATFALDPTSEIGFGGVLNSVHEVSGSAVPFQTVTLAEQGSAGELLNFNTAVTVARMLEIFRGGTVNTTAMATGSLTLLSSAAGTALVVPGTGTVSGAATVQRYLDGSPNAGQGYRHLSAPVSNTTVADLATSGFTPVLTQSYNTSATPGTTTPFPTVFGYDQARLATATNNLSAFDKGFVVPQSADALIPGRGYAVNLSAPQLVDFVGTLGNGNRTVSLARNAGTTAADAGWNLVGNPYPAPLDWSQVAAADRMGLDAAMYVFESTGQYAGSYRSYTNGIGNALIGSSQGFFTRVSSGQTTGSLTFRNNQRITDYATQQVVRRGAADVRPQLTLALAGNGLSDALSVYAEAGATAALDAEYDATKLANPTGLNLAALAATGEQLAIDGRPAFAAATSIPLFVGVPAAGSYTFTAASLANLAGTRAELVDNLTNSRTTLTAGASYAFTTTTTTAPGRFWLNLTPAGAPLATSAAALAAQVLAYPNPAHDRLTLVRPAGAATTAVLLNALGQVVRNFALPTPETTLDVHGLATGVYVLRLTLNGQPVTKRVVIE